jgi:hypothetical protein
MVGSNIMNASSPTISHKAHSGDSPIIGQQLGERYDLLWNRTAWRASAAPFAYTEAGIWRRCRVANAPARGSASRRVLTTSLDQPRFGAMWACVHLSFRTVWRKVLKKCKILDA